jgi:hypothetical protein
MLPALLLAAATATAPAPNAPAKPKGEPVLNLVPAFVGACMDPGPEIDNIKAVVTKAGGRPLPADPQAPGVQGYVFETAGLTYSVILDKVGTCTVVGGRVDLDATRMSLDQLVIGSSKVFDISQTDAVPRAAGETVAVEYQLMSKNRKGGLTITLSRVARGDKNATFLTRRIFANNEAGKDKKK